MKQLHRALAILSFFGVLAILAIAVAHFNRSQEISQRAELAREAKIIQERDSLARERHREEHATPKFTRYQWHFADEEE